MSYYLHFRKGGVNICNFCRVTSMYQVFDNMPPFDDKWEPVTRRQLEDGKAVAKSLIKADTKHLEKLQMIFDKTTDSEERWELADRIFDTKEVCKEYEKVIMQIDFLIQILEETDNQGNEIPMEWGIF